MNFQLPDGPSNETSNLKSETVKLTNCVVDPKSLALIGVAQDNSEANEKINMNPLLSVSVLHAQTEHQYAISGSTIPVFDGKKLELDRRPNDHGASEEESKSFMLPFIESEAPYCGRPIFCASRESTEGADYEGKTEDSYFKNNLNSHKEGSVNHFIEIDTAEPQEKAPSFELNASGENTICHDSESKSQILTDNRNFMCQNSEHYSEDKKIDVHRFEYNQVHTSVNLDEKYPAPTQCGFPQILPKCNNLLAKLVHHSSLTEIFEGCQSSSSAVFCNSAFQGNGIDTREVGISAPVDTRCYPSCGDYLETNGVCKAKEVNSSSLVLTVDGVQDPKEVCTMALGDVVPADVNDRPQVNTKYLKQSEFDSQVDRASVAQCNPENLCNTGNPSGVALYCASGGGNSCAAPEVIVLSNQAS